MKRAVAMGWTHAKQGVIHFDTNNGNKVNLVTLENGRKCWSFSSSQYVQNAVKNVEEYRDRVGLKLLKKAKSPWPSNYRPEINIPPELTSTQAASYYQSLISILHWIVELGQIDLSMETSAFASMMAMPRQGIFQRAIKCCKWSCYLGTFYED